MILSYLDTIIVLLTYLLTIVYVCVDKLPLKSTILPATSAERRYASVNGDQKLPSNVTSSSRDTCNGVIGGRSTGDRQETIDVKTLFTFFIFFIKNVL